MNSFAIRSARHNNNTIFKGDFMISVFFFFLCTIYNEFAVFSISFGTVFFFLDKFHTLTLRILYRRYTRVPGVKKKKNFVSAFTLNFRSAPSDCWRPIELSVTSLETIRLLYRSNCSWPSRTCSSARDSGKMIFEKQKKKPLKSY